MQAEPAIAVLGAIALYREEFPVAGQTGWVKWSKGIAGDMVGGLAHARAVGPGVEDEKAGKVAMSFEQKLSGAEENCAKDVDAWVAKHEKKLQDITVASQEAAKRTMVQEDAIKSILKKVELLAFESGLKTGNEELVSELGGLELAGSEE